MAPEAVKLEIISAGDALGITLPTEVLAHLKAVEGDTVFLIESSEGYLITTGDPEFVGGRTRPAFPES